MAPQNQITHHYVTQAGGGFGQFYAGSSYQKGHGIGSWLGGLFRTILPVLRSGASAVGKEAARAGSAVLADVASGQNFRGSVNKRVGEAAGNLANQAKRKADSMAGSGAIKRRKTASKAHNVPKTRQRKTASRPDYLT